MIITDSRIGMDSARTYTSVSTDAYYRSKSVTTMSAQDFLASLSGAYQNQNKGISEIDDTKSEEASDKKDNADTLSDNAESSLEYLKGKYNEISTQKVAKESKLEDDLRSLIKYMLLNFLLMLLLGKNGGSEEAEDIFRNAFGTSDSSNGFGQNDLNSLSFIETKQSVSFEHYESESEFTSFSSKGIVKTSDGREIDFGIDIAMSRSFETYTRQTGNFSSLEMRLMDPLVINLDTGAASISDQKFYFDLDSDGKLDEMSSLAASSGFLSIDLNGDGEINNGSELFGTKSGDGFKDLAQYDKDKNGWIDEADEVFSRLKIFCINEDGTTSQYSLKDKGVGAIYLGSENTDFTLRDQENNVNAQIRKTGLFLYESGSAGTMQHLDLAVELGA